MGVQQASDGTTPSVPCLDCCLRKDDHRLQKNKCGLLHPRKMLHLPHVVGNIVGDALVDLEDFVALAPFLRRACPSFAKAEWQLAAATSTRNQTRRVRFIMMISIS